MHITIRTIPHEQQRYETCGDWQEFGEDTIINVSEMGDSLAEILVGIHELVEVVLCRHRGISQEIVDKFDKHFEATRLKDDTSEPGDYPLAPYRKEHFFATNIERMIAHELGVDWAKYEEIVNTLDQSVASKHK